TFAAKVGQRRFLLHNSAAEDNHCGNCRTYIRKAPVLRPNPPQFGHEVILANQSRLTHGIGY
ncbi:MAG: hypothetical protein AAFR68_09545, partial [Pseudomonadota bacterium]